MSDCCILIGHSNNKDSMRWDNSRTKTKLSTITDQIGGRRHFVQLLFFIGQFVLTSTSLHYIFHVVPTWWQIRLRRQFVYNLFLSTTICLLFVSLFFIPLSVFYFFLCLFSFFFILLSVLYLLVVFLSYLLFTHFYSLFRPYLILHSLYLCLFSY